MSIVLSVVIAPNHGVYGVSTEKQRKKNWMQTFLNKIVKAREEEGINPKEEVSSSSFFFLSVNYKSKI